MTVFFCFAEGKKRAMSASGMVWNEATEKKLSADIAKLEAQEQLCLEWAKVCQTNVGRVLHSLRLLAPRIRSFIIEQAPLHDRVLELAAARIGGTEPATTLVLDDPAIVSKLQIGGHDSDLNVSACAAALRSITKSLQSDSFALLLPLLHSWIREGSAASLAVVDSRSVQKEEEEEEATGGEQHNQNGKEKKQRGEAGGGGASSKRQLIWQGHRAIDLLAEALIAFRDVFLDRSRRPQLRALLVDIDEFCDVLQGGAKEVVACSSFVHHPADVAEKIRAVAKV